MIKKSFLAACCALLITVTACADPLAEPTRWFNIPVLGITRITPEINGITAHYRGTIAYKNELEFDQLEFDLSIQPQSPADRNRFMLFHFNKERRDSSGHDHHLHGMDKHNRGYGIVFYEDGTAAVVRTADPNFPADASDLKVLLRLEGTYDYRFPRHIGIRQHRTGDQLEIAVELNRSGHWQRVSDTLTQGYAGRGFIGLMIYPSRASIHLSNLNFTGREIITSLNEAPRPLYLADYFEEPGRRLIHWRYDEWTSEPDEVLVESPAGELMARVKYPQNFWVLPSTCRHDTLRLRLTNIDGLASTPITVHLVDDHARYYAEKPAERIGIRPGDPYAGFCLKDSGQPFMVRGFNYVRLRHCDHSNFEAQTDAGPGVYDTYESETVLKILKKNGYNTVRVFIVGRVMVNPGISGYYEHDGLYGPYMDHVVDFIRRARKYGLYVFPTLCDGELPRSRRYWKFFEGVHNDITLDDVTVQAHNVIYVTPQGQQARAQYAKDFLQYIKDRDPVLLQSLLGLQCQNELTLNGSWWPFSLSEGTVRGPDGRDYDMADRDQRQALYDVSLRTYHEKMAEAVKSVDPDLLVGEGMFVPHISGKNYEAEDYGVHLRPGVDSRFPPQAAKMLAGPLDFVDIHIYYVNRQLELEESYRRDMVSTGLYSKLMQDTLKHKPFFMGEFGSFKFMAATFETARQHVLATLDLARQDHMSGFLYWTFDTFEQRSLWHAMEGGEEFLQTLNKQVPTGPNRP